MELWRIFLATLSVCFLASVSLFFVIPKNQRSDYYYYNNYISSVLLYLYKKLYEKRLWINLFIDTASPSFQDYEHTRIPELGTKRTMGQNGPDKTDHV